MQERVSVRMAYFDRYIHLNFALQNTRFSARLQQKFQQKSPIQQGFSEIFAVIKDSAKVSAKRIIQQGFS